MTLLFGFADRWSVDAYAEAESMSPMFSGATFDTDLNEIQLLTCRVLCTTYYTGGGIDEPRGLHPGPA